MLPQITVTTMASTKPPSDATNIHNTTIKVHLKTLKFRDVPSRYGISSCRVRSDLNALQVHQDPCSKQNLPKLIKDNKHLKISHRETKFTQAPPQYSEYSKWGFREASFLKATSRVTHSYPETVYVTPKTFVFWFTKNYLHILGPKTPSDLLEELEKGKCRKIKVKKVMISIEVNPAGKKTYLSRYKEDLIVSKAEIEADNSVGVTHDHTGKCL